MNWEDEPWIKAYTRETIEDLALTWEALAIWRALLLRVDRAGVLPLGKLGMRGLAALLRIPVEVVTEHLPLLLEDGRIIVADNVLIVPNFVEAQRARKSDRLRQQESRERRRSSALPVTKRDTPSQNVTTTGVGVTNRDFLSLIEEKRGDEKRDGGVGGEAAPPSSASASEKKPRKRAKKKRRHAYQDSTRDLTREVISYLNTTRGSNYGIEDDCNLSKIARLEQDGYTTFEPFRLVIDYKWREWRGTKVEGRVCPKTLFGPQNFATYLDEAKGAPKEDDGRGYKFEFGDDEDVSPLLVTPPKGRPN